MHTQRRPSLRPAPSCRGRGARRHWFGPLAALLGALLLWSPGAWAHSLGQVAQEVILDKNGPALDLLIRIRLDPGLAMLARPDRDRDGVLDAAERAAVARRVHEQILPRLHASLGGQAVTPRFIGGGFEVLERGGMVQLYYTLPLTDLPAGAHTLTFEDANFRVGPVSTLSYMPVACAALRSTTLSEDGYGLTYVFDHDPTELAAARSWRTVAGLNAAVIGLEVGRAEGGGAVALLDGDAEGRLRSLLDPTERTWQGLLLALAAALVLGAFHAFSPGHGKALVAAYLVGTRGRVRDALWLGMIVTLTHVAAVLVLGAVLLVLSSFLLPRVILPWIGVASGAAIMAVGFWMVVRRGHGHGHSHSHDHDHSHGHGHDHGHDHGDAHGHAHGHAPASWGELVGLGMAGGMTPCPSALVVLLAAVALQRIAFGMGLILAFSTGLAIVLITLGVLAVQANGLLQRFDHGWPTAILKRLPILSAAVVMGVGLVIAAQGLMQAGILLIRW